jgi:maleylacetate reductase
MRAFTFDALPGRVVFGVGSVRKLPDEVGRLGTHRVFLISDPMAGELPGELAAALGERFGGSFDDIELHVPEEGVKRVRRMVEEAGADAIVTVGGGSTTGYGKVVALETGVPIVAVPTTYAGSEMTPIYGITSDSHKNVRRDLRVLPKTVLYDPALTVPLPPEVTGPSGMNALAHCLEALYAREANPITSLMAEEAIRALARSLPIAVREPTNLEARSDAMYGAYLAGAALAVVGMALHHRICHVLGGTFGLAHGPVNAVILPHAARFNAEAAPEAMKRVAGALGTEYAAIGLFDLAESIGAPTSLAALGMRADDLDEAARLSVNPPPWNPRAVDFDGVRALLEEAFLGRRPPAVAFTSGHGGSGTEDTVAVPVDRASGRVRGERGRE